MRCFELFERFENALCLLRVHEHLGRHHQDHVFRCDVCGNLGCCGTDIANDDSVQPQKKKETRTKCSRHSEPKKKLNIKTLVRLLRTPATPLRHTAYCASKSMVMSDNGSVPTAASSRCSVRSRSRASSAG